MDESINDEPINKDGICKHAVEAPKLSLIGNKMSDHLFYTLAQTPLTIQGIERSGYKIVVCLSGHDFTVKGKKLVASGLVARDNEESFENIQSILDKNPESVALVSQIAKKYFDRETAMQDYKSRIFCLLQGKQSITNKPPSSLGKIKQVHIRH